MVQINFAKGEVQCKVVYYGPARAGKTANLRSIHERAPEHVRGTLTTIATDTNRTLFFDFLPLDLGQVAGIQAKIQLYAVPFIPYQNALRVLVLEGVDGVVFVADASRSKLQQNKDALENLRDNLAYLGREVADLPMVFQWNKTDAEDALSPGELAAALNPDGLPAFAAVAPEGTGVFSTLKALTQKVLVNVSTLVAEAPPEPTLPEAEPPVAAEPLPEPVPLPPVEELPEPVPLPPVEELLEPVPLPPVEELPEPLPPSQVDAEPLPEPEPPAELEPLPELPTHGWDPDPRDEPLPAVTDHEDELPPVLESLPKLEPMRGRYYEPAAEAPRPSGLPTWDDPEPEPVPDASPAPALGEDDLVVADPLPPMVQASASEPLPPLVDTPAGGPASFGDEPFGDEPFDDGRVASVRSPAEELDANLSAAVSGRRSHLPPRDSQPGEGWDDAPPAPAEYEHVAPPSVTPSPPRAVNVGPRTVALGSGGWDGQRDDFAARTMQRTVQEPVVDRRKQPRERFEEIIPTSHLVVGSLFTLMSLTAIGYLVHALL